MRTEPPIKLARGERQQRGWDADADSPVQRQRRRRKLLRDALREKPRTIGMSVTQ